MKEGLRRKNGNKLLLHAARPGSRQVLIDHFARAFTKKPGSKTKKATQLLDCQWSGQPASLRQGYGLAGKI